MKPGPKPNPKVPQLWAKKEEASIGVFEVRIVYPNGYVEAYNVYDGWDKSFLAMSSHTSAIEMLHSYGNEFIFNIE